MTGAEKNQPGRKTNFWPGIGEAKFSVARTYINHWVRFHRSIVTVHMIDSYELFKFELCTMH